jgi:hypothetical protein
MRLCNASYMKYISVYGLLELHLCNIVSSVIQFAWIAPL